MSNTVSTGEDVELYDIEDVPNPRLPRSTPSAYSRRGAQGEQGHTRAKGGGRQHSDAVRHFARGRSI